MDETPLEIGDRVIDKSHVADPDREPEEMLVVEVEDADPLEYELENGKSLDDYDANDGYLEASSAIVTVVFSTWLDANTPRWDHFETAESMFEYLEEMARQWDIDYQTAAYAYPDARLEQSHD